MSRTDLLFGVLFCLFGIFVFVEAGKLDYGGTYGAGPGLFPIWLGAAIILFSLILSIRALLPSSSTDESTSPRVNWKRWGLGVAAIIFFLLALERIGFVLSFTLLLVWPLLMIEGEGWRRATLFALIIGAGFYVFFIWLLQVDLPRGPFGL